MSSFSSAFSWGWLRSWEVALAALVLGASYVAPTMTMLLGWGDLLLWFGAIVLGTGLLRDLWALFITRPQRGERQVAMCAESIVGVAAIALGLALVIASFLGPAAFSLDRIWSVGEVALALAGSLVFSAWVHDLVFVHQGGRWQLLRHPDHGSFVVHLFRGQARACALPTVSAD
jgi:hypothetical protein